MARFATSAALAAVPRAARSVGRLKRGCSGRIHIAAGAKVFLPVSIERSVWKYFSGYAEQKGIELSELLTDVLKRDIEINEALK